MSGIGIGIGVHKNTIISDPGRIVVPPVALVGWWDFTKIETLFVSRAGTTAVTSNGDEIGWVKNIAPGDGNGDKLGAFLRSTTDTSTHRPVFKTGGVNGNSYADFGVDGSVTSQIGLRAGYFDTAACNLDGGETATKFSDLNLNMEDCTMFVVAKHDTGNLGTSSNDYLVNLKGYGGGGTSESAGSNFNLENAGTDYIRWSYSDASGLESVSTFGSGPGTSLQCFTLIGGEGTNAMQLEIDGTQEDQDDSKEVTINFSKEDTAIGGSPRVSVGSYVIQPTGATSSTWQGDVYEVMIYKGLLSADQLSDVETYITNKYGITFS
jgi:hypothetical protein